MTLRAVWAAFKAETPGPRRDIRLYLGFEEGTAQPRPAFSLRSVAFADADSCQAGEQTAKETTGVAEQGGVVVVELVGLADQFDETGMMIEQRTAHRLRQRQGGRAQRHLGRGHAEKGSQRFAELVAGPGHFL